MKQNPVYVVVLSLSMASWPGYAAAGADQWSLTLDAPVNSKYIWRGLNVVNGSVFQPSVAVEFAGLSASVWGNMDLTDVNDYGAGYGTGSFKFTEVDLTVGYTFVLDRVSLGGGLINYQFPNAPIPSTTELYIRSGFNVHLAPTVTVYHDVGQAHGTYVNFAASHSMPDLWEPSDSVWASLEIAAWIGFGTRRYSSFYYDTDETGFGDLGLSFTLPIAFGENWALAPTFNFSTLPDSDVRDAVANPHNFWFGLGLAYSY